MAKYVTIDLDKIECEGEEGKQYFSYLYYPICRAIKDSATNEERLNRLSKKFIREIADNFIQYDAIEDALGKAIGESINLGIIKTEDSVSDSLLRCAEMKNNMAAIKNTIELISNLLSEVRVDGSGENIKTLFDSIAIIKKLCGGDNASNA